MTIYGIYVLLLSMFVTSSVALVDPVLDIVGLRAGSRTIAIQAATLVIVGVIVFRRGAPGLLRELAWTTAVWIPWVTYLALRADFSDPYASLYVAKIIVIQYFGVMCLTAAILADPVTFVRVALPVLAIVAAALAVKAAIDPAVFIYASVIERMTVEDTNPIWLARSFAIGAMALLLIRMKPTATRAVAAAVLVAAIFPTGSRAPIIALLIVASAMLMFVYRARRNLAIRIGGASVALVAILLVYGPQINEAVMAYMSRGSSVGVVEESGRLMLFSRAYEDFLRSPIVGVGVGMFGASGGAGPWVVSGYYPHNMILEVLSTLGLIGAVLFVLLFRLGSWCTDVANPFLYLFALAFLFAMTSGDITSNSGVFLFATAARLYERYRSVSGRFRRR